MLKGGGSFQFFGGFSGGGALEMARIGFRKHRIDENGGTGGRQRSSGQRRQPWGVSNSSGVKLRL
jgi:hypothetical protein